MTTVNVRQRQNSSAGNGPTQLSLRLATPPASRDSHSIGSPHTERITQLDQRMTTAEVLRVVGVHRATLFRWRRKGTFPAKHVSGGWLRSDIERWLACRAPLQPVSRGILNYGPCRNTGPGSPADSPQSV